jgi:exopolysaccharide production protein ExoY
MSRLKAGASVASQAGPPCATRGSADGGNTNPDRPVGGHLKRAVDIALAAMLLVLLAPMFLFIATLLHFGLGLPVFTAQQRIGFAGRRFTAYAFSTSPTGDLARGAQATTCFTGSLRESGLDRLPELISVLRGDMSFVGPRPIPFGHPGPFTPDYLAAKPGLTGLCAVSRSVRWGDRRRAALDRYYARRWSMGLDLVTLVRSLRDEG